MPQKLLAEGAGILAKLVAGAVRYFKFGLQRPEEVSVARAEWRVKNGAGYRKAATDFENVWDSVQRVSAL